MTSFSGDFIGSGFPENEITPAPSSFAGEGLPRQLYKLLELAMGRIWQLSVMSAGAVGFMFFGEEAWEIYPKEGSQQMALGPSL